MKRILLILSILTVSLLHARTQPVHLTADYGSNPAVTATATPRLGWQIESSESNVLQQSFEIEITSPDGTVERVKRTSPQMYYRVGSEIGLEPLTKYVWRVRIECTDSKRSQWSAKGTFRTPPRNDHFDQCQWIGAISRQDAAIPDLRAWRVAGHKELELKEQWKAADSLSRGSIMLRREFKTADKPIVEAVATVSGLGFYELYLNGRKIGDEVLAPLWSDYDHTVYYNVIDLTGAIEKGNNCVGVVLGNGFYNVQGGRYTKCRISFGPPTMIMKLTIRYADNSTQTILSDNGWQWAPSSTTFNCIYGGEDCDARLEQSGWNRAGFDSTRWQQAVVQQPPKGELLPQTADPIKVIETYRPRSFDRLTEEQTEKGSQKSKRQLVAPVTVFDMGQNLAGVPRIKVSGERGAQITISTAESIDGSGAVDQSRTGRPHLYLYTLAGEGDEEFMPRFTYYGFQYIQIEGAVREGEPNPRRLPVIKGVESCFFSNSAATTGHWSSSNEILNGAHRIIDRAIRSNMEAVFTDCPHREKLGWLEELHLNGPALLYNYDVSRLIRKVARDMRDAQHPDGMVPTTAPQYAVFSTDGKGAFDDSPEWGIASIVAPLQYMLQYNDTTVVADCYEMMCRYTDYMGSRAEGSIVSHGLGDWYDYGDFEGGFARNTPVDLSATAHYYMAADYTSRAAALLGRSDCQTKYRDLANQIRSAFNERFYNSESKSYGNGSQCGNALALYTGLVEEQNRAAVLQSLVRDIRAHGTRLTTGDVGNRYLYRVLADNKLNDLLFEMFNHWDSPGYGAQLKAGYTTLAEQWSPKYCNSKNHFMLGQIEEWLWRSLAGIEGVESTDGVPEWTIAPKMPEGLDRVSASYDSIYGRVEVGWQREGDRATLEVTIPAGCTARIVDPDGRVKLCGSGKITETIILK